MMKTVHNYVKINKRTTRKKEKNGKKEALQRESKIITWVQLYKGNTKRETGSLIIGFYMKCVRTNYIKAKTKK